MLRLIGVVDLIAGRAVHARRGERDRYRPVGIAAGEVVDGDPLALAHVYVRRLGLRELYVADVSAIRDARRPSPVIKAVAQLGAPIWLDAGVRSVADAAAAVDGGAAHVVVGLETLRSYADLQAICRSVGGGRVAFSLDVKEGAPLLADQGTIPLEPVGAIAARAVDCGVGALIVLDLARVGSTLGPAFETIEGVRRAAPHVTVVAGGGVRGVDDLATLEDLGCDAALVATAVHDGRIDPRQSSVTR